MICWAAKWIGEDGIEFMSLNSHTKKAMVKRIWALLDAADVVVHYNGRKFDVPYIQREFLMQGLLPTSPFKQIDLLDTVRKQFNFVSNKLAHVSRQLGLEGKESTGGFNLWVRCMEGDTDAWKTMESYNIQDVQLLEDAYMILRPWIKGHPNFSAASGEHSCPRCQSTELQARGFSVLRTGRYQRYCCKKCGTWSRGTKSLGRSDITEE